MKTARGEREQSIGAFWKKVSQNGREYFSGYVLMNGQKTSLVMFKNDNPKSDKSPAFSIYEPLKKDPPLPPAPVGEVLGNDDLPF